VECAHLEWSDDIVPSFTDKNFDSSLAAHPYTIVDFYVFSQHLQPTWERFFEHVEAESLDVQVVKVDCVVQRDLCRQQRIMAFPTIRWYNKGQAVSPDYKLDRTVDALVGYALRHIEIETEIA